MIDVDRDPGLVMDGETLLLPPKRSGDCTCIKCCHHRRHHYIGRALLLTLLAVGLWILETRLIAVREKVAVMLPATLATFGALLSWGKPLRRLVHVRRPRSTDWPPPISL